MSESKGKGVPRDDVEAVKSARKAADQDHTAAQTLLAEQDDRKKSPNLTKSRASFYGASLLFLLSLVGSGLLAHILSGGSFWSPFPNDSLLHQELFAQRTRLAYLIIALSFVGWITFTVSTTPGSFLINFLFSSFALFPLIGMILLPITELFWVALAIVVAYVFGYSFVENHHSTLVYRLMYSSGITWVSVNIFLSLGDILPFSYSEPFSSVSVSYPLLNLRYLPGILFASLVVYDTFLTTIRTPKPNITSELKLELERDLLRGWPFLESILVPFIVALNEVFKVVNVVGTLGKYLCVYLWFFVSTIGKHIIDVMVDIFYELGMWKAILRLVMIFVFVVGFARSLIWLLPHVERYISGGEEVELLFSVMLFVITGIAVFVTARFCKPFRPSASTITVAQRVALCGATILLSFSVIGIIYWLLGLLKLFEIPGFENPGTYSVASILFFCFVFAVQLVRKLGGQRQVAEEALDERDKQELS